MLRSGLRVLLVEDPEAQKSSYAMAVEVVTGWDRIKSYPLVNEQFAIIGKITILNG